MSRKTLANLRTQLLYGLIFTLIFTITIMTFFSIRSLITSSEQVAFSNHTIGQVRQLEGLIFRMRDAARGFFLSNDKLFVERYEQYTIEANASIKTIKQMVEHDPKSSALLDDISTLLEDIYTRTIQLIRTKELADQNTKRIRERTTQQISSFTKIQTLMDELRLTAKQNADPEAEVLVLNIINELLHFEAQQRNFLFTGDEKFLDVFDTHFSELEATLDLLESCFTKKNLPAQQITTIKALLKQSESLLQEQEFKEYLADLLESPESVSVTIGEKVKKLEMEAINQKIDEFVKMEGAYLAAGDKHTRFTALAAQFISIFGNLVIILLGILTIRSFNEQNWLKSGHALLNERMKGDQDVTELTKNIISFIASYLDAKVGLFYLLKESEADQKPYLQLTASYAYTPHDAIPDKFFVGEGLIGEVAMERKPLFYSSKELTAVIQSALVQSKLCHVFLMPILFEDTLIGVFELGLIRRFKTVEWQFLKEITRIIGIASNTALARSKMNILLAQSQKQEKDLFSQRNELRQAYEELQAQSEELRSQSEELRQYNDELEQRAHELETQKKEIAEKNQILEKVTVDVEVKAKELEQASKYKSEFLANMSHELRTPLNSILMLAQILTKNNEGNLTDKQIEQLHTMYQSGTDLLTLINDVLDLSKVEAGKMEIHLEDIALSDLTEIVKRKFAHIAEGKGLDFQINSAQDLPRTIRTDGQRLSQIVTNLLANAFKFTSEGSVQLKLEHPSETENAINELHPKETLAIRVIDSGLGISKDKQFLIFEAFQQADGTTSRHYGGTGLGLSISREFSKLLGGRLNLVSEEGKGSTFTLYLPLIYSSNIPVKNQMDQTAVPTHAESEAMTSEQLDTILAGKKVLIVDDDQRNLFVLTLLLDEIGMITFTCNSGVDALAFLKRNTDIDVVLMDIMMPSMDGYETIKKIREQLQLKTLPIIAITAKAMIGDRQKCLEAGASDYITKPINNEKLISVLRVFSC